MRKSLWIIPLLFVAIWAPTSYADSVETYTGNPYATFPVVDSGYTTANSITATLTFENPLPPDASLAYGVGGIGTPTATDPLLAFVISDGNATFDLANPLNIFLVTGSEGQIVAWFVGGACGASCLNIDTQFGLPAPTFATLGLDGSTQGANGTIQAYVYDDPGTWKVTSTPEPSSLGLLGVGLLGFIALRKKAVA
jgi:hypothetical protein